MPRRYALLAEPLRSAHAHVSGFLSFNDYNREETPWTMSVEETLWSFIICALVARISLKSECSTQLDAMEIFLEVEFLHTLLSSVYPKQHPIKETDALKSESLSLVKRLSSALVR